MDNFESTCRTCNSIKSNLVNLSSCSSGNDNITLYDALCSVCPTLTIQNNDNLPQKICFFCSKQLEIAYEFQQQCKKSDEELLKVVRSAIAEEDPPAKSIENEEQPLEIEKAEISDEIFSHEENSFDDAAMPLGSPEFLEDYDDDTEMPPQEDTAVAEEITTKTPPPSSSPIEQPPNFRFECNLCEKRFLTSDGLLLHIKLLHKNSSMPIETFECKCCGQVFDSKIKLKQHSYTEHYNTSNELTCHICQKVFNGKRKLDNHLVYHGKTQFKCLVKDCKRTFIIKYKLTDHLKRFHGIVLSTNQSRAIKPTLNVESQS